MLDVEALQSIAQTCRRISNDVAETTGFVTIRRLLERFDVALHIRPLLVEGMLASVPVQGGAGQTKLAVLIDSETFQVSDKEVALEHEKAPLPTRFRNTVAHELLHSLAFRPGAFGLQLNKLIKGEKDVSLLVEAIEAETERLTPLLLWPEASLEELLSTREKPISAGELANLASRLGISRQVAITRLKLRVIRDGIVYAPWLRDVAVGIAEWGSQGRAVFRKWPLLMNFDRNVVPSFLHAVAAQDRLPASTVFDNEHFAMTGGSYSTMAFVVSAGVKDSSTNQQMSIVVSIEDSNRKPGTEFLFVVRKKLASDEFATEPQVASGD